MKLRPGHLDELAAAACHGAPASPISNRDLELFRSISSSPEHNTAISQQDLLNFCLIHHLDKLAGKKTYIRVLPEGIHAGYIKANYFFIPRSRRYHKFGGWEFSGAPHKSGDDLLDFVRSIAVPSLRFGIPYDSFAVARGYLDVANPKLPLTAQQVQALTQNAFRPHSWSLDGNTSEHPPAPSPDIFAPYLLRPHFEYNFTSADGNMLAKVARWIITFPDTDRYENIFILYTLAAYQTDTNASRQRWLPIKPTRKLNPICIHRDPETTTDLPLVILRDCHIEAPSELTEGSEIVAWPSSAHKVTPNLFDWRIANGRQTYIYADSTSYSCLSACIETYNDLENYNPRNVLFICNTNPLNTPHGNEDYFEDVGYPANLVLTNLRGITHALRHTYTPHSTLPPTATAFGPAPSLVPRKPGSIGLIHGTPLIGKTTLAVHLACSALFDRTDLFCGWPHSDVRSVLYVSNTNVSRITEAINLTPRKHASNKTVTPFDGRDFFLQTNPTSSINVLETHSSQFDFIVLDTPDLYWPVKNAWTSIMRFASRLRDAGKWVVIVGETKNLGKIEEFNHLLDFIAEVQKTEAIQFGERSVVTTSYASDLRNFVTNFKYRLSRIDGIEELSIEHVPVFPDYSFSLLDTYADIINNRNLLSDLEREVLTKIISGEETKLSKLGIRGYSSRSLQLAAASLVTKGLITKFGKARSTQYGANLETLNNLKNIFSPGSSYAPSMPHDSIIGPGIDLETIASATPKDSD